MLSPDKLQNINTELVSEIKTILKTAKNNIVHSVNSEMIIAYWHIGKLIENHELVGETSTESGKQFFRNLSNTLTKELGRGFSRSNLFNMKKLYKLYPTVQTLSGL